MSTTDENTSTNHETNKDNETNPANKKSSMNNIVIPLILLLVAVIVIVATFYENKEKDIIAQVSTETDDIAIQTQGNPKITDQSSTAKDEKIEDTATDTTNTDKAAEDLKTAEQSSPASTEDVTDSNTESAIPTENAIAVASPTNEGVTSKEDPTVAAIAHDKEANERSNKRLSALKSRAEQNRARIASIRTTYQNNPYANREGIEQVRQKAMVIAQQQAKKRDEMMQQRLAYEKEMQERRQRYEAAKQSEMKAREERRTQIADTQKAVYQRTEQNRIENKQRLQEMHKQLSEMHDEIHQLMRNSHEKRKSSAPVQVQAPSKEQI